WRLICGGGGRPLLGREASLRQAGRRCSYCQSHGGAGQPSRHIVSPSHFVRPFERFAVFSVPTSQFLAYGFATTSCCRSRSSSNSKSEYKSWFLSSACRSLTALPGSAVSVMAASSSGGA